MTAAPARLPTGDGVELLHKLRAIVRAPFQGDVIRIDPDDPVFARGRCRVVECERGAWSRLLCPAHYNR